MDTNVLYQALRSNSGASYFILGLIRNRKVRLALSIPVFNEYHDVLSRKSTLKDIQLKHADVEKVLVFISHIAVPYNISFLFRPNLRDEEDNKFVELGLVSNAQALITNNTKDFHQSKDLNFDDLNIVTPAEFITKWRKENEE